MQLKALDHNGSNVNNPNRLTNAKFEHAVNDEENISFVTEDTVENKVELVTDPQKERKVIQESNF